MGGGGSTSRLRERAAALVRRAGFSKYGFFRQRAPGAKCLIQVTAQLRKAGSPLPAFHPIELVDASIRGVRVEDLLAGARR